ncbi:hypothetical protein PHISP_01244 [Aspergillus sp. HF37]|nr:hypothetical protein PHISP_01244 [Aspergillus sp. HF37]
MAPLTADEQYQFLINCIKHSNQGKPNFEEVARECNIVSKGAAAKRYERLMKSHGISPSAIAAPSPSKSDKGGDDSEPAALVSATKAGGAKRKSAAGKTGPKAALNKRSRKKAAVASAERLVESHDKDEDGEDGGSEGKCDEAAGDAGIKQETDEAVEEAD